MSTTRPFAYNTGPSITGSEQIGNLAIGKPTNGFASTGLKWWNGPDEDLGYVIAHQTPSGQPGADGTTAYLGFWRSNLLTDNSFISLAETISGQSFTGGTQAKTWLNNNGYWTSYVSTPSDAIRAALSTSVTAYDAASVGNFIKITASEYANVVSTVTGTTKYVMNEIGRAHV